MLLVCRFLLFRAAHDLQFLGGEDLADVENHDELVALLTHAADEIRADGCAHARRRGYLIAVHLEDIEHGLVLTMTAAFGYALGGPLMWGSLRREATPERDAAFKERLGRLLEHSLEDARRSGA